MPGPGHGLGTGMMKERSVRELLDRFNLNRRRAQRDGWITLKKQNRTFVEGHTLAMFAAEFFPAHHSVKVAGPGRRCSPRHRMPSDSSNEG